MVLPELCQSLGTHEQHIGVTQHDTVHRAAEPEFGADQITAVGVNIVLEGHIVTVQTVGAAPVVRASHDILRIEHIGEPCYTYSQPQARIGIVGGCVKVLLVEIGDIRQSVGIGAESVHDVLAGLVEVATAVGHTFYTRHHQSVRPVAVTQVSAVVGGVLHSPYTLLAVLVLRFGTEIVVEILLQSVSSRLIDSLVGVCKHFLQVVTVDLGHSVAGGVVLSVRLVQIDFGEQCGSRSLCGATFVGLRSRQHAVGVLQIVGNELPALVVGVGVVTQRFVVGLGHVGRNNKRHVLVQTLQQEVPVRTEELHLAQALCLERITVIHGVERVNGGIHTAQTVVQTYPHVVDVPVGGHYALRYLQLVEHIAVILADAALVGVIRTDIVVPHRER